MTVHSTIDIPSGNYRLVDNEASAVVIGGGGNDQVTEIAANPTITLANGNDVITDFAGGAIVTLGTGDARVTLGGGDNYVSVGPTNGGSHDVTSISIGGGNGTVVAGDGNMVITATGTNNVITAGDGHDRFVLGGQPMMGFHNHGSVAITSDSLTLGNGTNSVILGGSGNTVYDGTGTDRIAAGRGGDDTFVINPGGGSLTIAGFGTSNGDVIDLTRFLPSGASNDVSTYITLATETGSWHATNTVLTITNGSGELETITLLNSGTITLAGLENSLKLP